MPGRVASAGGKNCIINLSSLKRSTQRRPKFIVSQFASQSSKIMSINQPKQIDYLAVRDSFIDAYAGALCAIFVNDEIFHEAVYGPIQFGYYRTTDMVFDKVERVDVLEKWGCYSKYECATE